MRRLPFFYGWVMVGTALAINAVSSTLNPVVFSFMIGPMSEDLGVSKSALAWSLTLRMFAGGLAGPIIGVLLDRHGGRWIGVGSGIVVGTTLILLGFAQNLWLVYLLFALSGMAGLGGPAGQLLTQVPLARWFVVKRGRALAIATMGMASGTVAAVPLTEWLLRHLEWRGTTIVFGVVVAAVVIPVSGLLVRRSPEDIGLHPDGAPRPVTPSAPAATGAPAPMATTHNWTVGEAMRTVVMWQLLLAMLLAGVTLTGTLVHRVAFFQSLGIDSEMVALGTMLDPGTVVFSAFGFGMLAERVPVRYLGAIGLLGLGASLLPMIAAQGAPITVVLHNVTWGVFAGGWITLNNLVWPNYFGRLHLGAIRGVVLPASIASSGLGPPLFGMLMDAGLPPTRLWMITAALFALAAVAVLLARPPHYTAPAPREGTR